MTHRNHVALLLGVPAVILSCMLVFAQTSSEVAKLGSPAARVDHDGQHDFDTLAGTWKAHTKYRAHPFAGSEKWNELDGLKFSKNFGTAQSSSCPK